MAKEELDRTASEARFFGVGQVRKKPKKRTGPKKAFQSVIGYVRVSTDKQELSVSAQKEKIRLWVGLQEETGIKQFVVDQGASGKTMDRPGFRKALKLLHGGHASGIAVAKLDRLTRSVADLGILMEKFDAEGWRLMSASETIDTETAGGRLVLNVLACVSQWEREAIVERTNAALAEKKRRHEKCGSMIAPYGWRIADGYEGPKYRTGKAAKLEPVPHEQDMMRLIIRMVKDEKKSYSAVASHLNNAKLTKRNGSRWVKEDVYRVFWRARLDTGWKKEAENAG